MKSIPLALLALAGLAANVAHAENNRFNLGVSFRSNFRAPEYVVVPTYFPNPAVVASIENCAYMPAPGHWENVTIKTWIPGRWVTSRDRWGRPCQLREEGRYAFRIERVWSPR